jgi:hypothetical protein
MKKAAAILTIGLMVFVGTMACSKEEPPPPPPKKPQKIKIVKPVEVQEPEKQNAPIPDEQEKGGISAKEPETDKVAVVGEVRRKETEEIKPPEAEDKPLKEPEKVSKQEGVAEKEAEGVKPGLIEETAKKQAEDLKTAGVEEKPARMQEKVAGGRQTADEETERYYIVKKGESLYGVASREDVYGNKLKWPILYRHNTDTLAGLITEEDVAERALPPGLALRIIARDEVEKNLEKRRNKTWIVNAVSVSTDGKIIPLAITLMKNGCTAYLTQVTIKGKQWTRLRVGFFSSRAEADAEKENIKDLLHLGDPWTTKVTEEEFEEFAGY